MKQNKNMISGFFVFFVVMILLSSGIGAREGADDTGPDDSTSSNQLNVGNTDQTDDNPSDSDLSNAIGPQTGTSFSVEDCIVKLKNKFPTLGPEKIKNSCEIMKKRFENRAVTVGGNSPNTPNPQMIENKLRVCIDYLTKNQLSTTPEIECKAMLEKNDNCLQFLKNKGIENPEEKCDKIRKLDGEMIKERLYVRSQIAQNVAEWKLKVLDSVSEDKPKLKELMEKVSDEKALLLSNMPRAKQQKIGDMNTEEAEKELNKYRLVAVDKEKYLKARTIVKEKIQEAKEKLEKAKERYEVSKENYLEFKNRFLEDKAKLNACKGVNSPECEKLKTTIFENAKEYVLNAVDMAISHLEKIKDNIESNENINETEAVSSVAEIDETIQKLTEFRKEVVSATTKEQIIEAAKKIDDLWQKKRNMERYFAGRVINSKIQEILRMSEMLEKRLDATLAKLKEQGIVIDGLDNKIFQFSEDIEEARTKFNEAKDLFEKARLLKTENATEEQKKEGLGYIEKAQALLKAAHEKLKEAHSVLVEINKMIRDARQELIDNEEIEDDPGIGDKVYVVEEVSIADVPAMP